MIGIGTSIWKNDPVALNIEVIAVQCRVNGKPLVFGGQRDGVLGPNSSGPFSSI